MKEYFKFLFKQKLLLIVVLISSFLLGFTVLNITNTYTSTYEVSFTCTSENNISFDEMITKEYLLKVRDICNGKNDYYNSIDINKLSRKGSIKITNNNENYSLVTPTYFYPDFFLKKSNTVSTRAKTYLKTLLTTYAEEKNYSLVITSPDTITKHATFSTPLIYILSTCSLVLFSGIYVLFNFLSYKKHKEEYEIEYDNNLIFKTPFHKKYWKDALKVFKNVKNLTLMAMLLGLILLCKMISVPSGFANLGISLTYIVIATGCMIFGPIGGFILGILSDTLGFILFQSGYQWFIGYTLQAAITAFTYGILFYKTKFSYSRAFIARLFVNFIMNVVWGSFCQGVIASYSIEQTLYYALLFSLPKNLVYLIPQTLVLYYVIKALCPALCKLGLIKKEQYKYYEKRCRTDTLI